MRKEAGERSKQTSTHGGLASIFLCVKSAFAIAGVHYSDHNHDNAGMPPTDSPHLWIINTPSTDPPAL